MVNVFLLGLGIVLASIGLFFIFLYVNLLIIGYSFWNFVYFIIRSVYCDLFFLGIVLIFISRERKKRNGLLL